MIDLTKMSAEDLLSYYNELTIHARAKRKGTRFRTKADAIAAITGLRTDLGSARVERIEESLVPQAVEIMGASTELTVPIATPDGVFNVVRKPRRLLEQLHTGMGCDIGFHALLTSWFHHNGYFKATASVETYAAGLRDYLGLEVAS